MSTIPKSSSTKKFVRYLSVYRETFDKLLHTILLRKDVMFSHFLLVTSLNKLSHYNDITITCESDLAGNE